jgi:hypothetical protein
VNKQESITKTLTPSQLHVLWLMNEGDVMWHSLMVGWTLPTGDKLIRVRPLNDRAAGELADLGLIATTDKGPSPHKYTITESGRAVLALANRPEEAVG